MDQPYQNLAAEVVLSGVDRNLSLDIDDETTVVRFKDDYRILVTSREKGISLIKSLQSALKEYRLELNDEKTQFHQLPDGIFRQWVSQYHSANPYPKGSYSFKRFKETCLSVISIDRANASSGVIDRFLHDIFTRKYRLRVRLNPRSLPKVLSLLLHLGGLRTKAFPKVLATVESILHSPLGTNQRASIIDHLRRYLDELLKKEAENRYLISWIGYFLRANRVSKFPGNKYKLSDPIAKAAFTNRFTAYSKYKDFKLFSGVRAASKRLSMLEHLDVFKPQ